ncbi:MAG: response regulator transcription factor [Chitinophagaceae bacterium]|nr:MAG: response regulator transcription factor [Chitinophagaceae bacterium]
MKKKILIVDDDTDILFILKIMLEMKGFAVEISAEPGKILLPGSDMPDLLLLDIWMGNYDGREICQQLKSRPATNRLPIILLSASKDIEQSAKDSGADDFVAKPFEQKYLLEKIGRYI